MHEFKFQLESSIHDLHASRQKPPLNFTIRGVQQVCEQIYIHEKKCNMTCYFTQQVKREYDGQDFKVKT